MRYCCHTLIQCILCFFFFTLSNKCIRQPCIHTSVVKAHSLSFCTMVHFWHMHVSPTEFVHHVFIHSNCIHFSCLSVFTFLRNRHQTVSESFYLEIFLKSQVVIATNCNSKIDWSFPVCISKKVQHHQVITSDRRPFQFPSHLFHNPIGLVWTNRTCTHHLRRVNGNFKICSW